MLSGYFAIPNLVATYAERIDLGDFEGVADLFAHATITVEENDIVVTGKAEAQAMYSQWTRRYEDTGTPKTRHVTTNLILDVDDEAGTGTCRCYFTVLQRTDSLPFQPIIAGRYHDRFERVDGVWRFAHRHMINDLTGDLSQHMLADPFPDRV
jgi:ketosteroid isomerase-like protein